ncbi:Hsp70-Hsp90 organizing protein 2 (AtHop2) [Durusdinium trenchii]|uniref:Hsp70-Hsp90 organizing protein 2 (AtHop2) n=1 Tax=Durusdinium trenchii TaxID=1381693 RepID=A0ABP0M6Z3_9DINO
MSRMWRFFKIDLDNLGLEPGNLLRLGFPDDENYLVQRYSNPHTCLRDHFRLQLDDDLAYAFESFEDAVRAGGQALALQWVEARAKSEQSLRHDEALAKDFLLTAGPLSRLPALRRTKRVTLTGGAFEPGNVIHSPSDRARAALCSTMRALPECQKCCQEIFEGGHTQDIKDLTSYSWRQLGPTIGEGLTRSNSMIRQDMDTEWQGKTTAEQAQRAFKFSQAARATRAAEAEPKTTGLQIQVVSPGTVLGIPQPQPKGGSDPLRRAGAEDHQEGQGSAPPKPKAAGGSPATEESRFFEMPSDSASWLRTQRDTDLPALMRDKQVGREEWMRLRHDLMPLLRQGPIIFLAQARQLLPRQLLMQPAASEYQSTKSISVRVGQAEQISEAEEDSSEENSGEVIQMAKQKVQESRQGEEVDFDDLDILDELEEAAAAIRKERREQRRRRRAAREVWIREAKLEAKRATHQSTNDSPGTTQEQPPWLWKQLAKEAFKRGDYYQAQLFYTKEAQCLGLEPFSVPFSDDGAANVCNEPSSHSHQAELATALSNRALCFTRLRHFDAALLDGRRASLLRPNWGRAWSRIGAAATALGAFAEACDAWRKAVQLDPCDEALEGLEEACRRSSLKVAGKEQGNEALRARDWHGAIACFTEALAAIPRQSATADGYSLLRCILYSNRSGAFARAGRWTAATRDAEFALAEGQTYPKAYTRLGVALLGSRENEKAYAAFAKALKEEERNQAASKGRQACLHLVPQWLSSAAKQRRTKLLRDACRPRRNSRVFLLSELRFGHASNEAWVHGIHATKFLDDVLILTGNVADSLRALERALTALRPKFRRIFYTPGNNEMWITPLELQMFPDSLCKLWAILELCDRLGIDVAPAAISEGVFVVPLFSWYNPEFDTEDPYPDTQFQHDKHAKWPMDPNHQVWRYMLALNKAELKRPYHGTVLTFSHFVPRSSLPVSREYGGAKVSGCAELDDQLRDARSSCHLYGHTFKNFSKEIDGVAYINYAHKSGGLGT